MGKRVSQDMFYKLTVKVPRGHQGFWDIMRALGGEGQSFTLDEVQKRSNVHSKNVHDYVKRLLKGGYLEVVRKEKQVNCITRYHYKICKNVISAPRLRRDGTECVPTLNSYIWRTMRMVKEFDAKEIADLAQTDKRTISANSVNKYLQALCKAGYLRVSKPHGNKGFNKYRLLPSMNTGDLPPKIMRSKAVWDQNLNKVMGDFDFEVEAA